MRAYGFVCLNQSRTAKAEAKSFLNINSQMVNWKVTVGCKNSVVTCQTAGFIRW